MREDYRVPLHMMQVKNLSQIQQDQLLCLVISLVRRSAVISHPRLLDLLTIEELENEFERKPQHNQSHDQHCSNAHGNVSRELMEFSPCVGVKIIDVGHRFAQKVAQGCPALLWSWMRSGSGVTISRTRTLFASYAAMISSLHAWGNPGSSDASIGLFMIRPHNWSHIFVKRV
mmetsp:Transcript_7207/g.9235  ORF Transcript_7207/g.9235 Transcript_7207/m.9235 type:complete len:173 (-) Transcript_7207:290-808(-)